MDIDLIPGRRKAPRHLGSACVLGAGLSGLAAARYLARLLGDRLDALTVYAGSASERARVELEALERTGARVICDDEKVEGSYDFAVASPGIPQRSAFYQAARACSGEVISEVELAWRESRSDARWVAVSGTNGKSTTTALIAHLLCEAGVRACAVGNIGRACIEAVSEDAADIYVAELSSYQLSSLSDFAADARVLLGLTPDHVSWHGSLEAYYEAKARLFDRMRAGDAAIVDATNEPARAIFRSLRDSAELPEGAFLLPIGTCEGLSGDMRERCGAKGAAFLREADGMLCACSPDGELHALLAADELRIPGAHNAINALAGAGAALALGCAPEDVARGLSSFRALEHRIEACGTVAGVRFYNDSKATNVDATLAALAAFDPARPIIMLGGDDKGTDLAELVEAARTHAAHVVLFGASRPRFEEAFAKGGVPVILAERLADALAAAAGAAHEGDIVLLSPACASFDEFSGFEERGRVFKELVARMPGYQGE